MKENKYRYLKYTNSHNLMNFRKRYLGFISPYKNGWVYYHILFWIAISATFFMSNPATAKCDFVGYVIDMFIGMAQVAALMYSTYYIWLKLFEKNVFIAVICILLSLLLFSHFYGYYVIAKCNGAPAVQRNISLQGYITRFITGFRYIVFAIILKFVENWYRQEKKVNEIKIDKLTTELNYLRSQINPHFLFNNLNNLYGLALKKSDKTAEVIVLLSEMMDYMLYESSDLKVSLQKDIKNVSNYIDLEVLRQGNNAIIEFNVEGQAENLSIAPLLLLPLTENAFKHGVNSVTSNGFFKARVNITGNTLTYKIENNLNESNEIALKHGVGLKNLKSRLELFYPGKYKLLLKKQDNKHITDFELILT